MNDAQIINGLRVRETKAFDAVFDQLFRPLCFFAAQMVRNEEEGKDIAIESFAKLWSVQDPFQSIKQVRVFLYKTAKHACLNYNDKQRSRENYNRELLYLSKEAEENTIEKFQMQASMLEILLKEIERLPEKSREAFKLSYLKGLSNSEIAKMLHITESTVRSHINNAKHVLRLSFTEKELLVLLLLLRFCEQHQNQIIR